MTLFVLLTGIGLFAFAMTLHLLVWRYGAVRREMFWLFVLFFGCPLLPLVWLYGTAKANGVETFAIALLWIALASAYAQTYPVLRHVIPSFRILLLLRKYGHAGLSEEEIIRVLAQDAFCQRVGRSGERFIGNQGGGPVSGYARWRRPRRRLSPLPARSWCVRSGLG